MSAPQDTLPHSSETKRMDGTPAAPDLLHFDEITRLRNRRFLWEFLRDLKGSRALLWIDIDHLKAVNDTRTRKIGDFVIQELAKRLAHIAGMNDLIVR